MKKRLKQTNNSHRMFIKSLFLLLVISFSQIQAQTNALYDLGEQMLNVAKSQDSDIVLSLIDVGEDLDKKALILESFMKTKSDLSNITDMKSVKLFNVVKEKDSLVYFILKNKKKYFVVKSTVDAQNKITDVFSLLQTDVTKKLQKGEMIYKTKCYSCHGLKGKGGLGPNLTDDYCVFPIKTNADLYDIIANGKKGTTMIAFKNYLSKEEIDDVVTYMKSLNGIKVRNGKAKEGDIKKIKLELFN